MSARRKQEEKHLEILKKNLQIECNKKCAECDQRGPTYVDVTIGSFVCTSCGGILRGLNPAHRVKSVSMATFTPTEIAFVEMRGNDYCKNVYLGKYDSRSKAKPEAKHPAKLKYFMELKYEQKRWYLPPVQVDKNKPLDSFVKSATNGARRDKSKPESNKSVVQVSKPSSKPPIRTNSFANDFSTLTSATTTPSTTLNTSSGEGFADFSNAFASQSFDAFGDFTAGEQSSTLPVSTASKASSFSNILAPMSMTTSNQQPSSATSKTVDKYADLGDLFSTENIAEPDISTMWSGSGLSSTSNSKSGTNNVNTEVQGFGTTNMTQQPITHLNSTSQQQACAFGTAQSFTPVFSTAHQQTNVFGQPAATPTIGNMAQLNMMSMQQQANSAYNNIQQMPAYGNSQLITGSTSQFNSPTTFGATSQNSHNPKQQPQIFSSGSISAPYSSNPFVQPAVASLAQPPSVTNPFMVQQSQNSFPSQAAATNPFMQNFTPSQNQTSTNPFF